MIKQKENEKKLDILVASLEVANDAKDVKIIVGERHNLTFEELKDTLIESIELQFEDLEKRMKETGKKFDSGIVFMPLVKINYKK
jgi:hypothetical protein